MVYATVDFDGRQKVVAVGGADARRLPFSRAPTETPARQEWRAAGGFARVEEIPRRTSRAPAPARAVR